MSDAGGAAFNPMVRTEDGPAEPEPPETDCAEPERDDNETDDRISGEDQG